MANERNGQELLGAFWAALRELDGLDMYVAAPYVLLAGDRLIAGEDPEAVGHDVRASLPPHLLRLASTSPADMLVERARNREKPEASEALERFITDREKRSAAIKSPLGAGGGAHAG